MPAPHQFIQFFTGWMPFLPPNQQRQSTKVWIVIIEENSEMDLDDSN